MVYMFEISTAWAAGVRRLYGGGTYLGKYGYLIKRPDNLCPDKCATVLVGLIVVRSNPYVINLLHELNGFNLAHDFCVRRQENAIIILSRRKKSRFCG